MCRRALLLLFSLMLTWAVSGGCSSPGSVSYSPLKPSTAPASSTLASTRDQTISGGNTLELPAGGIAVKAEHSLTLTWTADGNLQCVILSSKEYEQYKSFRQSGKESGTASAQYSQGTITKYVQSDDVFYGVLINNAAEGTSVHLSQATLKEQ
jgi:hypothetical protein